MQARAVNVQFGIGLTILIRLVIVKTLVSLVNFYIVKADTPFLLYLIDNVIHPQAGHTPKMATLKLTKY